MRVLPVSCVIEVEYARRHDGLVIHCAVCLKQSSTLLSKGVDWRVGIQAGFDGQSCGLEHVLRPDIKFVEDWEIFLIAFCLE